MSTINELARLSDVLLFQEGEEVNFIFENATVLSGTLASTVGQVLGKVTIGAVTVAAAGAGGGGANTGNGTCVADVTTPVLANALVGVYTAKCTVAGTNSATFRLTNPTGDILGDFALSGSGASVTVSDQIKFAITDGSTDFAVGDGFTLTVAAGSGKYAQVTPAAFDGTQIAAGVLAVGFAATLGADTVFPVITNGPAILKTTGLAYTSGMSDPQKAAVLVQLRALGIKTEVAYGA